MCVSRVGCRTTRREAAYGQLLGRYLDDPANLFVVSSDFCHWGDRFRYTFYDKNKAGFCRPTACLWSSGDGKPAGQLIARRALRVVKPRKGLQQCRCIIGSGSAQIARRRRERPQRSFMNCVPWPRNLQGQIWQSVKWLDEEGMTAIETVRRRGLTACLLCVVSISAAW
jgi:predicted class III extradiol MEMO1 family dioxygenase